MRRIGGMPTILPPAPRGGKDRYPYISANASAVIGKFWLKTLSGS